MTEVHASTGFFNNTRLLRPPLVVMLLLLASFADAEDEWIRLRSENFQLITNAKDKKGRETLYKLEQFRHVLSLILPNQKMSSPVPTHVYAFKNRKSYRPYLPLYQGKPKELSGYFQRGPYKNIIAIDLSSRSEEYDEVIFHEFVHLMLSYNLHSYPLWFEEGVAEFYANCVIRKDYAEVGRVQLNNRRTLMEQPPLPLEQILEADRDSPIYNHSVRRHTFYAQSWALVHYLVVGQAPKGQQQLTRFLQLLSEGKGHDAAFLEAFEKDTRKMRHELELYVSRRIFKYMRFALKPIDVDKDFFAVPLSAAEVSYHLGDLLLNMNRLDEARAHLRQTVEQAPEFAPAYESLGFLCLRQDDYEQAASYLKMAVQLDSVNPVAHFFFANTLLRGFLRGGLVKSIPDEMAEPAIASLRKSMELNPGYSEAAELLGFIFLVRNENIDEGIVHLEKALSSSPGRPRSRFVLAQLRAKRGDYDLARQHLSWVSRTAKDAGLRKGAQQELERIEAVVAAMGGTGGSGPTGAATGPTVSPTDPNGILMVEGTLIRLDCPPGKEARFVVKSEDKIFVLMAAQGDVMILYKGEPSQRQSFRCGPQQRKAIVRFIPSTGKSKNDEVHGRLVSLNLLN